MREYRPASGSSPDSHPAPPPRPPTRRTAVASSPSSARPRSNRPPPHHGLPQSNSMEHGRSPPPASPHRKNVFTNFTASGIHPQMIRIHHSSGQLQRVKVCWIGRLQLHIHVHFLAPLPHVPALQPSCPPEKPPASPPRHDPAPRAASTIPPAQNHPPPVWQSFFQPNSPP